MSSLITKALPDCDASPDQNPPIKQHLLRKSPATFALAASNGRWKPALHLTLLDQTLLEALDDAAAGKLDGLVISMPPQHGKSELCSKYLPAWYLGTHPDHRVILVGYEADFAASWGRKARDLLEEYGPYFGVRVSPHSKAANRWDLAGRQGGMSTAGVGGPITGKGANLLIVDDPVKNDEEARSASARQKQWEWWQSVATTRLRPGGLTVVIQTRWHRDDLTGRILEQANAGKGVWRSLVLPALALDNDPLERPPNEPLWPEMYSLEKLLSIRQRRTNYYWQSLYQQSPIGDGGAEWPDDWFGRDIWFDDWPTDWRTRVVALDPSKGEDSRFGDYSAFVMLQRGPDGKNYIDADLAHRNTKVMTDQALEIQRTFRPKWFGVEVNQFQQLLADQMAAAARVRGDVLPLHELHNNVSKIVRIRRLTPLLAQGMLKFKANSQGARLLVEQLRDFPHADHDDGPDALEMAVRIADEDLRPQRWDIEFEFARA